MSETTMDIDAKTPSASSSQHSMTSLTSIITSQQLGELNSRMNKAAQDWKEQFGTAKTAVDWRSLFQQILPPLVSKVNSGPRGSQMVPAHNMIDVVDGFSEEELEEVKGILKKCLEGGTWEHMVDYPKLRTYTPGFPETLFDERKANNIQKLTQAYQVDYFGGADQDFLNRLKEMDTSQLYAKVISVVQSSATGKSRMLTEVGRSVFTLPICLRAENSPGYPVGDHDIHKFFENFQASMDDVTFPASNHIAAFLAAAHSTMLKRLQALESQGFTETRLREEWHRLMELDDSRQFRQEFFKTVLETGQQFYKEMIISPTRTGKKAPKFLDPVDYARQSYGHKAKQATKDLMALISKHIPGSISITYFDEAHNLGQGLWTMARLLSHQDIPTRMWYVYMGTKSRISYHAPKSRHQASLRFENEESTLPPPYIGLGFDLNIIHEPKTPRQVSAAELQGIAHLCKYGRPIWKAQYQGDDDDLIGLAMMKLTCTERFDPGNKDHVFAILSQRLGIDALMAGSEALELAETSMANHMRLLIGFSSSNKSFTTGSPSEPILNLGACRLLYSVPSDPPLDRVTHSHWPKVLETFTLRLCVAGLIDKGRVGELVPRTLVLIARDFATPPKVVHNSSIPDLLKPIRLVDVLRELLNMELVRTEVLMGFEAAFACAYVNYTHWMIAGHNLPEADTDFLVNLWARGVAVQCCFNPESLDCIIPIYFGSKDTATQPFRPSQLSALIIQIKYRTAANLKAEAASRPISVPRNSKRPLPYLAMLWELGSDLQKPDKNIQLTLPESTDDEVFADLVDAHNNALGDLATYKNNRKGKERNEATVGGLEAKVQETRKKRDDHNRYALTIRGVSPQVCKILEGANIKDVFQSFFTATMPDPDKVDNPLVQQMRPLSSTHIPWSIQILEPREDDVMIDAT